MLSREIFHCSKESNEQTISKHVLMYDHNKLINENDCSIRRNEDFVDYVVQFYRNEQVNAWLSNQMKILINKDAEQQCTVSVEEVKWQIMYD